MTHHPLEDVIFSLLLKRVDDTKLIQQLIADHNDLEVVTRKLRHTLAKFEKDHSLLNELNHQLSTFISRQRQHMYIEEIEVYPLIEQLIKPADWEHAETIIQLKDDPVFGARTQNDYETLYREIEARSQ